MRIGVFICSCSDTITNTININSLSDFAKNLPNVAIVETRTECCQSDTLQDLTRVIQDHQLDRIVIAACSPQLFGHRFQEAAAKAGLTKGQIAYANIREHCAWVHAQDPESATAKAKRLIRSAVHRVAQQKPTPTKRFTVPQEALVLGGGIAGIQAALDLANQGFKVHLVERTPSIGGHMALLVKTFPTDDCAICIEGPKMAEAATHPNIVLYPYTELVEARPEGKGFVVTLRRRATYVDWSKCTGCLTCTEKCPTKVVDEWTWGLGERKAIYMPFSQSVPRKVTIDPEHCLKLTKGKCGVCAKVCPAGAIDYEMEDKLVQLRVGSVILATGFEEFDPSVVPELMFGRNPDVVTQMQLARMLDTVGPMEGKLVCPSDGRKPQRIVMIQCVGSRDERFNRECSRYCCMAAMKHAILTKIEQDPNIDITILCRDVRAAGKGFEEYYVRAREEYGVKFLYWGEEVAVVQREGKTFVEYRDPEGKKRRLAADLVVLSCAMVPSKGTRELAEKLGVQLDEHGFFQAVDEKVALTRTNVPGVFLCGACHGPKDIPESVAQASAAAQEAAAWMSQAGDGEEVEVASVDEGLCNACGLCVAGCYYHAVTLEPGNGRAVVDEARCQGCGECFSLCPVGAISPLNTNRQVLEAAVEGLLGDGVEGPSPLIVGFACSECCYRAVDEAGERRLQYPAGLHIVEVPCTGGVSSQQVLRTLEAGADGVILFACDPHLCHYGRGARMAASRASLVRSFLSQLGGNPERVQVVHMIGRDAEEFAEAAQRAVDAITNARKGG